MRVKKTYLSKGKVIISGEIIEVYEYKEKAILRGYERPPTIRKKGSETERNEEAERINLKRTRKGVRRLINANEQELRKFITLTFRENETDVGQCNYEFKKFIQRLKHYMKRYYPYKKLSYIAVIEFQKRGAVHYHMLTNVEYLPVRMLAEIWGHGFVKINRIETVSNLGAYVSKYMSKDERDQRLWDKKMYHTSRDLNKPVEITENEEVLAYKERMLAGQSPTYQNTFKSEYLGDIDYKQYNLKQTKKYTK